METIPLHTHTHTNTILLSDHLTEGRTNFKNEESNSKLSDETTLFVLTDLVPVPGVVGVDNGRSCCPECSIDFLVQLSHLLDRSASEVLQNVLEKLVLLISQLWKSNHIVSACKCACKEKR